MRAELLRSWKVHTLSVWAALDADVRERTGTRQPRRGRWAGGGRAAAAAGARMAARPASLGTRLTACMRERGAGVEVEEEDGDGDSASGGFSWGSGLEDSPGGAPRLPIGPASYLIYVQLDPITPHRMRALGDITDSNPTPPLLATARSRPPRNATQHNSEHRQPRPMSTHESQDIEQATANIAYRPSLLRSTAPHSSTMQPWPARRQDTSL